LGLVLLIVLIASTAACSHTGKVYTELDRDVQQPEVLRVETGLPFAVCPESVRASGAAGVHLHVGVTSDGSVATVEINEAQNAQGEIRPEYTQAVRRSGCDRRVEAAMKQWKFRPAEANGRPVAYRLRMGVVFNIGS
jgi:hypothetical protein